MSADNRCRWGGVTAVLHHRIVPHGGTYDIAAPHKLALLYLHHFGEFVVTVVAAYRAAGIGHVGVWVTQAMCHTQGAKCIVLDAEIRGVVFIENVGFFHRHTGEVGVNEVSVIRFRHAYGSVVELEQLLADLRHRLDPVVAGLHRAGP